MVKMKLKKADYYDFPFDDSLTHKECLKALEILGYSIEKIVQNQQIVQKLEERASYLKEYGQNIYKDNVTLHDIIRELEVISKIP